MTLKEKLKKFMKEPGDPPKLALAFAMGLLLGILPGTGAIVAAGVATVFKLNIALAVAGALFINPLTAPFVYAGSYFLGRWIIGNAEMEQTISRILLTTITGNIVMATAIAVIGYFVVWGLAVLYMNRHRKKK